MVVAAFLGSIAPTTDDDSLAYPIPIAKHLVRDGLWRFWPDQALSTYPLSQELLEASLLLYLFPRLDKTRSRVILSRNDAKLADPADSP